MRRKPASESRGTTLSEVLVVTVITGVIFLTIAALSKPMFVASGAEQAKVDTVQSIAQAKFRLQRDIRQSDPNGIYVCANASGTIACTPASNYSTLTDAPYLAILTLHSNGDGAIAWDPTGRPAWTGFDVYWLQPDGSGTNTLMRAFAAANIPPGTSPAVLNADVDAAVATAMTGGGETVALSLSNIQTMVDVATDRVALRVFAQAKEGMSTGETSIDADVYARN